MKKTIQIIIGLIIGLACLWIVFRNTDWREVAADIRGISIPWLAVAVAFVVASFFTRIMRWGYIVRAAKPVSFRHMFSATQIGFLFNFTLPGRVGELVRAVVLSRLAQISFSKCIAMVALDRVTDILGLMAVIAVSVFAYSPQGRIVIPKETFGREIPFSTALIRDAEVGMIVLLVAAVTALVLLYLNQGLALRLCDACTGRISRRLSVLAHGFLEQFAQGLHIFRSASDMAKCVLWSLVTWGIFLIVIVALLRAFHIEYPWYTVFIMELLVAVAISVPGAPGFVGQFHIPIVVALMLLVPGMDPSKAKAVAIVTHLINLIPVLIVGVFCMIWEDFRVSELRRGSALADAEPGIEK